MKGLKTTASQPPATRRIGTVVELTIGWNGHLSKHKTRRMTDEAFVAYQAERDLARQHERSHFLHFARPVEQWTVADFDRLLGEMVTTLRRCPVTTEDPRTMLCRGRWNIYVNRFNCMTNMLNDLTFGVNGGARDFSASVKMPNTSVPRDAFGAWVANLNPYSLWVEEQKRGVSVVVEDNVPFDWKAPLQPRRH